MLNLLAQNSNLLAQNSTPLGPQEVWGAWSLEPTVLLGLSVTIFVYRRGQLARSTRPDGRASRSGGDARWRTWCFTGGLAAVAVALVSPLDAMAGVLASAHMVQHVALVLVAAPLLALSAPAHTLLRGTPMAARRATGRWRRRLGLTPRTVRALITPAGAWLLHVGVLWFWHAAAAYDAALSNPLVHVLEHATFLLTALLFWRVVIGGAGRVAPGYGVLLVFGMSMQSVFLSALLTFASTPWYDGYATTTQAWGLTPLADQQLAGVIMWVPAGAVYLAAGLTLMAGWINATERDAADQVLTADR
jgi:cytochrome c oxidase assembly factor CtaG